MYIELVQKSVFFRLGGGGGRPPVPMPLCTCSPYHVDPPSGLHCHFAFFLKIVII